VIGSAFCSVVIVVITQRSPQVHWVQAYGPNVAAMFLGVAFTVGAVQLFLDREQKRLRAPAERSAVAAAREVWFPVMHMITMSIQSLAPDDASVLKGDFAHVATEWERLMIGADLSISSLFSQPLGSGFRPIPLREFIAGEVRASIDAYRANAALITQFCPPALADAMQDLMQGQGNQLLHLLGWGSISRLHPDPAENSALRGFVVAFGDATKALDQVGVPVEQSTPATYVRNRGA
jgi:hypothetical protein